MDKKTFYITTPIYYPSDKLHIGHAYTTVAADSVARLKRMQGFDVMFLTGTDEHGQKIARRAEEAGQDPQAFVDGIVAGIKELWALMGITYDRFIRTTDPSHKEIVQKIFKKLYDQGDIYKSEYEGLYCAPCEAFWTETQARDGKCPDCGREVERAKEEGYFFRLSKYQDRMIKYFEDHPDFLLPKARVNEMMNNFLKPGLGDLCVSRTSFTWGIPVTFDEGHVIYVWLDALSNYITALGFMTENDSDFKKYWPADIHLMAKEIVRFHSIIWPIMLMALDVELPKQVFGHGWLLLDGGKMSKSKGNVVDPAILCARYGVDAIRYFLLREIPFGSDGVFSNEALIARINSDLANDLGNLVSRTCAMNEKYFGSELPSDREAEPIDAEIESLAKEVIGAFTKNMEALQFPAALSEVWRLISRANKYIDETTPWILGRDEGKRARLSSVMYTLCEAIRLSAIMLAPVMPSVSAEILSRLGVEAENAAWEALRFGAVKTYRTRQGDPLFPRIDAEKELLELAALSAPKTEEKRDEQPSGAIETELAAKEQIGIDDFGKVEMRVGRVLECEPVPKSDKLLRLIIDFGAEKRQIVSGIAEFYKPAELLGKNLIAVTNLAPVKLRGVESRGMILTAECGDRADVLSVGDNVPLGSVIR